MSTITGDDTHWAVASDTPDDGDNEDAASVNVPFELLLDAAAYLGARLLTWTPSGWTSGNCGSKVRIDSPILNTNTRFAVKTVSLSESSAPIGWVQSDVTDGGEIAFEIIPPHAAATLQTVRVQLTGKCNGGAGHAGGLPAEADRPIVRVLAVEGCAYSLPAAEITHAHDPSTTVGQYDAPHEISVTVGGEVQTKGKTLYVLIEGEQGASSVASTTLFSDITCTWGSEDTPP